MEQLVLAVLMVITADGTALQPVETVKMTIEQCLSDAFELNSNPDHPYVLMCGPIVEGVEDA